MDNPDAPRFAPLSRSTLSTMVRDAIAREIQSGALGPGHPLPSERELTEQFNVSRTSIREAVYGLLSIGLIEKRGNRAFVVERLPEVRLDKEDRALQVRELFAVRRILEQPIAASAAEFATDAQRAHLRTLADSFHEGLTVAEFRDLDRQFHLALAATAGNRLLAELLSKVLESLISSEEFDEMLRSSVHVRAVRQVIASSVAAHRRLASAVASADVQAASQEIAGHLHDVEEQMLSYLG